jgi:S-methylmethionine-dependent homocysteine/selenocysteine methylase
VGYRDQLPQLDGDLFLTDGGIETSLIFHDGIDLPLFAAFTLLRDEEGTAALRRYYAPYVELAADSGHGFVLESPTWRASPRWAGELGISPDELDALNRKAIDLMAEIRDEHLAFPTPFVISGCIGPQGDGYSPEELLSRADAQEYHSTQIRTFADTQADMVTAITMTYVDEAVGVAEAARAAGMPVALSFTVETDGSLPSGDELGDAINETDLATDGYAAYFMINCAHPTHFDSLLRDDAATWRERVRGVRANASVQSHAELDEATELDAGDPADLGVRYAELAEGLPRLNVVGGCCGTDSRHVAAVRDALASA